MERILQRWYDMISIRSVNGHEAQMADYVANVLRELGMDPHYSYFEEDTVRERPSVWSVLDSGRSSDTSIRSGYLTAGRPIRLLPRSSTARSTAAARWT